MKGLLTKDFRLMMLYKKFYFFIIIIVVGMLIFTNEIEFPLGFLACMLSLLPLNTISYDDFDNGNAFLFTLPITRNIYVVEKYILGLLASGTSWILATILAVIITLAKETSSIAALIQIALPILSTIIILQAIMLPCMLKFGADKGRTALFIIFGALMALAAIIINGIKALFSIDLVSTLDALSNHGINVFIWLSIVVAFLILFISLKISLSIMDKKEF